MMDVEFFCHTFIVTYIGIICMPVKTFNIYKLCMFVFVNNVM